jgi:hypothetical protein
MWGGVFFKEGPLDLGGWGPQRSRTAFEAVPFENNAFFRSLRSHWQFDAGRSAN